MKHFVFLLISAVVILCTSCNKKESLYPDLSGRYTCSFSIPDVSYRTTQTVTLTKTGDTSYSVRGKHPFEEASISYSKTFFIPQTDIVKNGKTYYLSLSALLTYENGTFKSSFCQAAYGEKGVTGKVYDIKDFKLVKK